MESKRLAAGSASASATPEAQQGDRVSAGLAPRRRPNASPRRERRSVLLDRFDVEKPGRYHLETRDGQYYLTGPFAY